MSNIDQDAIRKMAENLAKGKIDKIFVNNDGGEKKEYDKDFSSSRKQMNITNENMKTILSRSQTIVCEKCNNYTFSHVTIAKRISPFISPTGEEMMVPMSVLSCTKCNHINKQFLPDEAIADILEKEESSI